jgi:hypothetical protein
MTTPLTDRKAIRLALEIACDTEEALVDAWDNDDQEKSVVQAKRNIAAFKRVLDRHFGGRQLHKHEVGKSVSLLELLKNTEDKP